MLTVIIVAVVTFGIMYLADRSFTKHFRSRDQHKTGLSVRLRKAYAVMGILVSVLAVAVLVQLANAYSPLLLFGGLFLLVLGVALVVYYMTFGIFYDDESFILTTFGKKSVTYRYSDIQAQQLYTTAGGLLIELYLSDGRTVGLQQTMEGVYPFLDKACHARFRQLGVNSAECAWFDESQSCWFPPRED